MQEKRRSIMWSIYVQWRVTSFSSSFRNVPRRCKFILQLTWIENLQPPHHHRHRRDDGTSFPEWQVNFVSGTLLHFERICGNNGINNLVVEFMENLIKNVSDRNFNNASNKQKPQNCVYLKGFCRKTAYM